MSLSKKIKRRIDYYFAMISDFFRFKKERLLIGKNCYVMISHNAQGDGGAPVVLFELAKLIKNNGSDVVFLSCQPGDLMNCCREAGIYGYTTGKLHKRYLKSLISYNPSCFIVNTMLCHDSVQFLMKNYKDGRVYWWVHEENKIVQEYATYIDFVPNEQFRILCVSERVKTVVEKSMPHLIDYTAIMYYGCNDLRNNSHINRIKKENDNKYIICSIGYISERKNQLQLVEAVESLPKEIRDRVEVHFVYGSADKAYFQKLKTAIESKPYYKLIGAIPRDKMADLYMSVDLLVCSSVDDPLPVVVTEAMMLKTPFITSSETGQYALVNNTVNGYTYDVANTYELTQQIILAYENRHNEEIIQRARDMYESTFSLQVLEKNFTELMT